MAMELNLTLVIQIFHFLIAYALLTRFLLKPAMVQFELESSADERVKEAIAAQAEQLASLESKKKANWQSFQSYFFRHKPQEHKEQQIPASFQDLKQPHLQPNTLHDKALTVAQALKSRLTHD